MTESFWLQLASLIVSAISAGFVLWLKHSVNSVEKKTNNVITQNEGQAQQLSNVHTEINSRLTQYIDAAVKAALAEGMAIGVETERTRKEGLSTPKKKEEEKP